MQRDVLASPHPVCAVANHPVGTEIPGGATELGQSTGPQATDLEGVEPPQFTHAQMAYFFFQT